MTTASKITVFRVIVIPFFMVALCLSMKFPQLHFLQWFALFLFIIASISDFADGYIARHYNQVTNFGKFLDPLADKIQVMSAMIIFVGAGRMPSWAIVIVLAREFAVTGLRLIAVENGRVIAAGWSGKIKTTCTMIGLIVMMVFTQYPVLDLIVTWIILVTTVCSGIEYFVRNRDCLNLKS